MALQPPAQPAGRQYPPPPDSEPFWPAQLTVLAAIGIQLLLPERLTVGPLWLVPSLEGVLLIGLIVVTPNDIEDEHPRRRRTALSLTAFVSAANIFSLGALTHFLLAPQRSGRTRTGDRRRADLADEPADLRAVVLGDGSRRPGPALGGTRPARRTSSSRR